MRRIILAVTAILALVAALSLSPNQAEAATMPMQGGLAAALEHNSIIQEAATVCSRVWRCGPYGCGWRRVCRWVPNYGYRPHRPHYRPHGYYRPYGYYRRW